MFHLAIHQKGSQDSKADNATRIYYSKGYGAKGRGKIYATAESREVRHRVPRVSLSEATQE